MKLQDFDFRIWDNIEKKYIDEIELHKYEKCPIEAGITFTETDRISEVEFVKNKNDLYIEPWTGLYDKNGKKIYEGDILYSLEDCAEDEAFKYKVVFKEGAFYLVTIDDEFDEDLMSEFLLNELEVIGNIHENKELLK